MHVYSQAMAVDPTGPAGVTATDGMQLRVCSNNLLCSASAFQGAPASGAFSAMASFGGGRVIARKRTSQAGSRFLLSDDYGQPWQIVGCAGSTGAHTYFIGQNANTVLSDAGDTGSDCLMRSATGASPGRSRRPVRSCERWPAAPMCARCPVWSISAAEGGLPTSTVWTPRPKLWSRSTTA